MPEDLKLSQIGCSQLLPPFRGLHSPGVRKHCQIIFACYFRKSSIKGNDRHGLCYNFRAAQTAQTELGLAAQAISSCDVQCRKLVLLTGLPPFALSCPLKWVLLSQLELINTQRLSSASLVTTGVAKRHQVFAPLHPPPPTHPPPHLPLRLHDQ